MIGTKAIIFLIILAVLPYVARAGSSDTSKTATPPSEEEKAHFELSLRLANESNPADGIFGPVTYGLIGSYTAANGAALEGTFVRMHEPGMRTFDSFLDEGQLTLKLAPMDSLTLDGTWWRNRMIDMYTTIAGPEATIANGQFSYNFGLYAGSVTRDEAYGRFLGGLLGIATAIGPVQLSLSHVAGVIHTPNDPSGLGKGTYHKTGLEGSWTLNTPRAFPTTLTASIERRYFNFGMGGPRNELIDTYIFVLGVEISLLH